MSSDTDSAVDRPREVVERERVPVLKDATNGGRRQEDSAQGGREHSSVPRPAHDGSVGDVSGPAHDGSVGDSVVNGVLRKVYEACVGNGTEVVISKLLTFLLRHAALTENLTIRSDGYAPLKEVMETTELKGNKVTVGEVMAVACFDAGQRFSVIKLEGDYFIRANTGHTIPGIKISQTEETFEERPEREVDQNNDEGLGQESDATSWESSDSERFVRKRPDGGSPVRPAGDELAGDTAGAGEELAGDTAGAGEELWTEVVRRGRRTVETSGIPTTSARAPGLAAPPAPPRTAELRPGTDDGPPSEREVVAYFFQQLRGDRTIKTAELGMLPGSFKELKKKFSLTGRGIGSTLQKRPDLFHFRWDADKVSGRAERRGGDPSSNWNWSVSRHPGAVLSTRRAAAEELPSPGTTPADRVETDEIVSRFFRRRLQQGRVIRQSDLHQEPDLEFFKKTIGLGGERNKATAKVITDVFEKFPNVFDFRRHGGEGEWSVRLQPFATEQWVYTNALGASGGAVAGAPSSSAAPSGRAPAAPKQTPAAASVAAPGPLLYDQGKSFEKLVVDFFTRALRDMGASGVIRDSILGSVAGYQGWRSGVKARFPDKQFVTVLRARGDVFDFRQEGAKEHGSWSVRLRPLSKVVVKTDAQAEALVINFFRRMLRSPDWADGIRTAHLGKLPGYTGLRAELKGGTKIDAILMARPDLFEFQQLDSSNWCVSLNKRSDEHLSRLGPDSGLFDVKTEALVIDFFRRALCSSNWSRGIRTGDLGELPGYKGLRAELKGAKIDAILMARPDVFVFQRFDTGNWSVSLRHQRSDKEHLSRPLGPTHQPVVPDSALSPAAPAPHPAQNQDDPPTAPRLQEPVPSTAPPVLPSPTSATPAFLSSPPGLPSSSPPGLPTTPHYDEELYQFVAEVLKGKPFELVTDVVAGFSAFGIDKRDLSLLDDDYSSLAEVFPKDTARLELRIAAKKVVLVAVKEAASPDLGDIWREPRREEVEEGPPRPAVVEDGVWF